MSFKKGIIFAALALLAPCKPLHAWIFEQIPDKAVLVHYQFSVAAAITTNTVIIDLSDTSGWPHKDTGELNIDYYRFDIDRVATSSTSIKLGVLNYVNSSTGSVTWFAIYGSSLNVSNTSQLTQTNFLPASIKCRVNTGLTPDTTGFTPFIFSNDKTSGSTLFQTDVVLPSPNGNIFPGVGDIILQVVNGGASTALINADILYHSNSR